MDSTNNDCIAFSKIYQVIIKTSTGYEYLQYDDIIRFEADGNYTKVFHIYNESPSRAMHNLSKLLSCYSYKNYYRCHKSHIVNLTHIRKLYLADHKLQMTDGSLVPVSENSLKNIRSVSAIV